MIAHATNYIAFATLATLALTSTAGADLIRRFSGGSFNSAKFLPNPTAGQQCEGVQASADVVPVSVSWDSSFCGKQGTLMNFWLQQVNYVVAYHDNGLAPSSDSDPYIGINAVTYLKLGWMPGMQHTGLAALPSMR